MNEDNEWHKALVLALRKLGVVEMLITQADMDQIQNIQPEGERPCALVFQQADGVHIKLVTYDEARELSVIGALKPN